MPLPAEAAVALTNFTAVKRGKSNGARCRYEGNIAAARRLHRQNIRPMIRPLAVFRLKERCWAEVQAAEKKKA